MNGETKKTQDEVLVGQIQQLQEIAFLARKLINAGVSNVGKDKYASDAYYQLEVLLDKRDRETSQAA